MPLAHSIFPQEGSGLLRFCGVRAGLDARVLRFWDFLMKEHKLLGRRYWVSLIFGIFVFAGHVNTANAVESDDAPYFYDRSERIEQIISLGKSMLGTRYKYGGELKESGLDCSGLVKLTFKEALGVNLPRTSAQMAKVGEKIKSVALQPGDLVFFNTMHRAFSHVGIYMGNNEFLHAPHTGASVRVESMNTSYWSSRYNGARRLLAEEDDEVMALVRKSKSFQATDRDTKSMFR